jgi:hypothetical protein
MPNRSDYKTRKEYRFAKKIEKRELSKDPLLAAIRMSGKKMDERAERIQAATDRNRARTAAMRAERPSFREAWQRGREKGKARAAERTAAKSA